MAVLLVSSLCTTFPSWYSSTSNALNRLSLSAFQSRLLRSQCPSAEVSKVSLWSCFCCQNSGSSRITEIEMSPSLESLDIEGVLFPATIVAPGSSKSLVLAGAGDRALPINGTLLKFTAIGIYVDEGVISYLSPKLKGKTPEELSQDELLFEELLRAPYEMFVRVVLLLPLTGVQYSEKVLERIDVQGLYKSVQEKYRQQFLEVFKAENFTPRSSILFSISEEGLKIAFSKEEIPKEPVAVIEDATFGEAVIATIIWKDGVSPAAKASVADRFSKCL